MFSQMREVKEIIVVCDPSYKDIFQGILFSYFQFSSLILCLWCDSCQLLSEIDAGKKIEVELKFAVPGKERQDSVFNGFQVGL